MALFREETGWVIAAATAVLALAVAPAVRASDAFGNNADAVYAPARRAVAIMPDDAAVLPDVPKAIYVGTGGTIVMRGVDGSDDQAWLNVPSGALMPFRARSIRATGTTAGNLLALY